MRPQMYPAAYQQMRPQMYPAAYQQMRPQMYPAAYQQMRPQMYPAAHPTYTVHPSHPLYIPHIPPSNVPKIHSQHVHIPLNTPPCVPSGYIPHVPQDPIHPPPPCVSSSSPTQSPTSCEPAPIMPPCNSSDDKFAIPHSIANLSEEEILESVIEHSKIVQSAEDLEREEKELAMRLSTAKLKDDIATSPVVKSSNDKVADDTTAPPPPAQCSHEIVSVNSGVSSASPTASTLKAYRISDANLKKFAERNMQVFGAPEQYH